MAIIKERVQKEKVLERDIENEVYHIVEFSLACLVDSHILEESLMKVALILLTKHSHAISKLNLKFVPWSQKHLTIQMV